MNFKWWCSGLALVLLAGSPANAQSPASSPPGPPSNSPTAADADGEWKARQQQAEWIKANDPRAEVAGYQSESIEGWPIRIQLALVKAHANELDRARQIIRQQLQEVRSVVPAAAVRHLQTVPIWLSLPYPGVRPTGEYHPNLAWLRRQGRPAELHQCVELTNVLILDREVKRMPMLLVHELAHAYHDQVLGWDHPEIRQAYQLAVDGGSYDAVARSNGKTERAYALTTPMEYFAETSEAWFGINDFFPFDRRQLERHDPRMAQLLMKVWNSKPGDLP